MHPISIFQSISPPLSLQIYTTPASFLLLYPSIQLLRRANTTTSRRLHVQKPLRHGRNVRPRLDVLRRRRLRPADPRRAGPQHALECRKIAHDGPQPRLEGVGQICVEDVVGRLVSGCVGGAGVGLRAHVCVEGLILVGETVELEE